MKKMHIETPKIQLTRNFWIKYLPSKSLDARPSIGPLWHALANYHDKIIGQRAGVPITAAYRTLNQTLLEAKKNYPHLGLRVLENGREMFPAI